MISASKTMKKRCSPRHIWANSITMDSGQTRACKVVVLPNKIEEATYLTHMIDKLTNLKEYKKKPLRFLGGLLKPEGFFTVCTYVHAFASFQKLRKRALSSKARRRAFSDATP